MSANRIDALSEFISRPTTNPNERANAQRALDQMESTPEAELPPADAACWSGFTGPEETVRVEMPSFDRALQALGEPMTIRWDRKYWAIDRPQTLIHDYPMIHDEPRGVRYFVSVPIKKMREARPPLAMPAGVA